MQSILRVTPVYMVGIIFVSLALGLTTARAEEPWRLDSAISTPQWLKLSGSYRLRYEHLNDTFRVADPGTDSLIVSRLLLAAEARLNDKLHVVAELQDSSAFGAEAATPLGVDDVNALEALQLYLGISGRDWIKQGDTVDVRLGRFTMGMGSNRLIGRHIYRNTINAFTGASVVWASQSGPRVEAFATNPVIKLPRDRAGLEDNDVRIDRSNSSLFWGVFVDRFQVGRSNAEAYAFVLDESDNSFQQTRNRDLLTIGGRLLGESGNRFWQVEAAYQTGEQRATTAPTDLVDLDHDAWLVHAEIGKQLDGRWSPRASLRYDYASGDRQPNDGESERFDPLYGPLRFDFGPTGLFNAVGRRNTNTLGVYVNLVPATDKTWMIGYRAAWLASSRDSFGNSGVRDVDGLSSSFVGQQIETRFRWELIPDSLRFETGGAVLFKGEFLENAPNAPATGNTMYVYGSLLYRF